MKIYFANKIRTLTVFGNLIWIYYLAHKCITGMSVFCTRLSLFFCLHFSRSYTQKVIMGTDWNNSKPYLELQQFQPYVTLKTR